MSLDGSSNGGHGLAEGLARYGGARVVSSCRTPLFSSFNPRRVAEKPTFLGNNDNARLINPAVPYRPVDANYEISRILASVFLRSPYQA